MQEEYRMKDTRNDEGTGSLMVERLVLKDVWSPVSRHWFYKGQLQDITIYEDSVKEVNLVQITDNRSVWSKEQKHNRKSSAGWFNFTQLKRKDAPLKKKGDC